MSFDELFEKLHQGGITMVFILLASVLALIVAFERLLALWGAGGQARALSANIEKHLLRGDIPAARALVDRSTALSADVFRVGFERAAKSTGNSLDSAVDRERQHVSLRMKRGMWILGTIGATTPFVGLFGTVAGIMRSFKDLNLDISAGGTGGSAAVMIGISEALVATAAGIIVAVEAVVLYNIFQARLARLNVELRLMAEAFVELLRDATNAAPQVSITPPPDAGKG